MMQQFESDEIWTSDENDYQPETLEVTYDPSFIAQADKLLRENPWLQSVTFDETVDFEVDAEYEGKARDGRITVSQWSERFTFTNDWTNTTYTVELPDHRNPAKELHDAEGSHNGTI